MSAPALTARDVLDCARSARQLGRDALCDALLDLADTMLACPRCGCVRATATAHCALCGHDLLARAS